MKNIVSTDDSVKRQITDSISENLTDSDLESGQVNKILCKFNKTVLLNEQNTFFRVYKLNQGVRTY